MQICEIGADGIFMGNTAEIGERDGSPPGWVRADPPESIPAGKVALWANAWVIVDPPATVALVPEDISSRQFFQQLALDGDISEDDALAYVQTGVLPQALVDAIALLPAGDRFGVRMALIGANTFGRSNPLTRQIGALLEKTGPELDALWISAAKLP